MNTTNQGILLHYQGIPFMFTYNQHYLGINTIQYNELYKQLTFQFLQEIHEGKYHSDWELLAVSTEPHLMAV